MPWPDAEGGIAASTAAAVESPDPAGAAGPNRVDVIARLECARRSPDCRDKVRLGLECAQPLRGDLPPDEDHADHDGQRAGGDRDEREIGEDPALQPHPASDTL